MGVLALLQMVHDARRPLVWTSEKPTAPGWYWHRYGEGRRAEVINVQLREGELVEVMQEADSLTSALPDGQFAGPITEPIN